MEIGSITFTNVKRFVLTKIVLDYDGQEISERENACARNKSNARMDIKFRGGASDIFHMKAQGRAVHHKDV